MRFLRLCEPHRDGLLPETEAEEADRLMPAPGGRRQTALKKTADTLTGTWGWARRRRLGEALPPKERCFGFGADLPWFWAPWDSRTEGRKEGQSQAGENWKKGSGQHRHSSGHHDGIGAEHEGKKRGKNRVEPQKEAVFCPLQGQGRVQEQKKQSADGKKPENGFFHGRPNMIVYTLYVGKRFCYDLDFYSASGGL